MVWRLYLSAQHIRTNQNNVLFCSENFLVDAEYDQQLVNFVFLGTFIVTLLLNRFISIKDLIVSRRTF